MIYRGEGFSVEKPQKGLGVQAIIV